MSGPELDLDYPAPERSGGVRRGPPIPLLAGALACVALGLLAGSVFAGPGTERYLPIATLSARDLYLDTSTPAAGLRLGRPVIELRLTVDNPAPSEIRLRSLILDDVSSRRTVLPLNGPVPARGSATVDVKIFPDCRAGQQPRTLKAGLSLARQPGLSRSLVPVLTTGAVKPLGGLCSLLDLQLPRGWRDPILAGPAVEEGADLKVTVEDLSGLQTDGVQVGDRLLSSVLVGARQLSSSSEIRPGRPTLLRLIGPPPCIRTGEGGTTPAVARLLAKGAEGQEQRLIVIGPELARWLRRGCNSSGSS
jgi:hypothetical protein